MTLRNNRTKYEKIPLKDSSSGDDDSGTHSSESPTIKKKSLIKLKREIGIFSGVCLVVSTMIGSGIFVVPTGVLKYCDGDVKLSILIWGIGGLIAMLAALCVCELGASIPESGSWMTFIHYSFGPLLSFIFTWMTVVVSAPEGLAAQFIALGEYMTRLYFEAGKCEVPNATLLKKLLGVSVALVIMVLNMTKVKWAVRLQIFCAFGKVVALVGISTVGFIQLLKDSTVARNNFMPGPANASSLTERDSHLVSTGVGISAISLAIYQGLWAYDGFEVVTIVTEEVKNPSRSLPIITIIAVPVVTLLYMIVNVAYFSVLTPSEMLSSHAVAVTFGQRVHPFLAYLMTLSVCMSLIGSINGHFLATARVPFVAGRLGHMPEFLSMAHVRYYSPVPAILISMGLGALMLLQSNFDVLVTASLFTMWGFRGLSFIGLLYLRVKRKDLHRPYKVYTATAVMAILVSAYLIAVPLVFQPEPLYLLSVVLIAVFAVMYKFVEKGKLRMSGIGPVSIFLQKVLLVAPTSRGAHHTT
uniref:b(0,+)-type amino acid transporter 1-like n=1 Tax=Styela clava TaxID=7725 RepID=UPI001939B9CB|nr:b(0,+)-type amino acid transporter 1-like [Styela clava]